MRYYEVKSFLLTLITSIACLYALNASDAPARSATSAPGLANVEFITSESALTPGSTLTVGLLIEHLPGYHTYWRGPGIVGVATVIDWTLPEGFEAGPIQWPAPEKVDMVGIAANGFHGETLLLTEIQVPAELADPTYTFKAKVAWMACAKECNPGVADLEFSLPSTSESTPLTVDTTVQSLFDTTKAAYPIKAPSTWTAAVHHLSEDHFTLTLTIPKFEESHLTDLDFFCDDMQVDSNAPVKIDWDPAHPETLRLTFQRTDFSPKNPTQFSGLLFSSNPLPGTDSSYVEISTPWVYETEVTKEPE